MLRLIEKSKTSLSWLLGKHISSLLPEKEERVFKITATIQLYEFIIGFIFWNLPLNNPTYEEFFNYIHILLYIELILSWFLLRKGFIIFAPVLLFIGTFIHIVLIDFSIPISTIYLFYSTLTLSPFLIIHPSKNYLRFILSFLPIAGLVFHQLYFEYWGGTHLLGVKPSTLRLDFVLGDSIFSQVLLLIIIFIFIRQANRAEKKFQIEHEKSEKLLLNILPLEIAKELKEKGYSEPRQFEATVCFTDFKGFTEIAKTLKPKELVSELDKCFTYFDTLMDHYKLEKLKTIGDSYMFAGGIPIPNNTHAVDTILAALEIQGFMNQMKEIKENLNLPYWELRLGIHTGELIAGVIGEKKFAYDVWSDTVNTASRCESSGEIGRINISKSTYEKVKDFFECEYRGIITTKNKEFIQMYFVNGLLPELQDNRNPRVPNKEFEKRYNYLLSEPNTK